MKKFSLILLTILVYSCSPAPQALTQKSLHELGGLTSDTLHDTIVDVISFSGFEKHHPDVWMQSIVQTKEKHLYYRLIYPQSLFIKHQKEMVLVQLDPKAYSKVPTDSIRIFFNPQLENMELQDFPIICAKLMAKK